MAAEEDPCMPSPLLWADNILREGIWAGTRLIPSLRCNQCALAKTRIIGEFEDSCLARGKLRFP